MQDDDILSPVLGRRQILRGAGVLGVIGLARLAAARRGLAFPESPTEIDVSDFVDEAALQTMCVLTPSETQGPYYLNLNLVRSDITEGFPGLRTHLMVNVVRASDCTAVTDAVVDAWHADATGRYSGFANQGTQGQTFLRGVQTTDATGLAAFDTIYPGWYMGRTTHIHLKVRPTGQSELTTQLYFPTGLSRRVYRLAAYAAHGQNPTTNANDSLYLPETVVNVLGSAGGQLQLQITIGIA